MGTPAGYTNLTLAGYLSALEGGIRFTIHLDPAVDLVHCFAAGAVILSMEYGVVEMNLHPGHTFYSCTSVQRKGAHLIAVRSNIGICWCLMHAPVPPLLQLTPFPNRLTTLRCPWMDQVGDAESAGPRSMHRDRLECTQSGRQSGWGGT